MSRSIQIAERLREVYLSGRWVANTNWREQLGSVDWKQATQPVAGLNTIALLTFHINYYLEGLMVVLNGGPLEIKDKFSFDAPVLASEKDWQLRVNRFLENAEAFAEAIAALPDNRLDEVFVNPQYGTWLRNIEAVIEHGYYHLGQVVMLKKLAVEI